MHTVRQSFHRNDEGYKLMFETFCSVECLEEWAIENSERKRSAAFRDVMDLRLSRHNIQTFVWRMLEGAMTNGYDGEYYDECDECLDYEEGW